MINLTSCFDYLDIRSSDQKRIEKRLRDRTCLLYSQQAWDTTTWNFVKLLSWSSAFDICKHDSNRALFDVDYQTWMRAFWRSSDFDVLRRASIKKISKRAFKEARKISKLVLMLARRRTSKSELLQKALISDLIINVK
jgi:hypothetical protein